MTAHLFLPAISKPKRSFATRLQEDGCFPPENDSRVGRFIWPAVVLRFGYRWGRISGPTDLHFNAGYFSSLSVSAPIVTEWTWATGAAVPLMPSQRILL